MQWKCDDIFERFLQKKSLLYEMVSQYLVILSQQLGVDAWSPAQIAFVGLSDHLGNSGLGSAGASLLLCSENTRAVMEYATDLIMYSPVSIEWTTHAGGFDAEKSFMKHGILSYLGVKVFIERLRHYTVHGLPYALTITKVTTFSDMKVRFRSHDALGTEVTQFRRFFIAGTCFWGYSPHK